MQLPLLPAIASAEISGLAFDSRKVTAGIPVLRLPGRKGRWPPVRCASVAERRGRGRQRIARYRRIFNGTLDSGRSWPPGARDRFRQLL